ncbi:MAG: hypothetical protein K2W92_00790 [Alphaproteobacteria bacterium]|nr:hypothetical protein [Alphaproteobacteria bacterium]
MQNTKACFQPYANRYTVPFRLTKTTASKDTTPLSTLHFSNIKKCTNSYKLALASSKKEHFHELEQELPHNNQISFEEAYSQVKRCLSLIEDPLWKSICTEMTDMMGPFAVLKMWDSRLGSFSRQYKTMDLYCQTEEVAQFIRQYSFVILGSLQRYFPMMKDLRIKLMGLSYIP